jgi:hypothetical protein
LITYSTIIPKKAGVKYFWNKFVNFNPEFGRIRPVAGPGFTWNLWKLSRGFQRLPVSFAQRSERANIPKRAKGYRFNPLRRETRHGRRAASMPLSPHKAPETPKIAA